MLRAGVDGDGVDQMVAIWCWMICINVVVVLDGDTMVGDVFVMVSYSGYPNDDENR
jgi:hypothetical protein